MRSANIIHGHLYKACPDPDRRWRSIGPPVVLFSGSVESALADVGTVCLLQIATKRCPNRRCQCFVPAGVLP